VCGMQRKETQMISSSSKFMASVLFVLLLDQAIKFLAVSEIINLEFNRNSGALFGVWLNANLIFAFFAVFLFVAVFSFKKVKLLKNSAVAAMAFCLMLGGIASNLTDRILYGQIIDYINLFNLFSFNIADLAICFSALVLGWKVLGARELLFLITKYLLLIL
jgi:signal peptidase II